MRRAFTLTVALFAGIVTTTLLLPSPKPARAGDDSPLCTIQFEKEMFITDTHVVDDCWRTSWGMCPTAPPGGESVQGCWTFKRLIEGISGATDPTTLDAYVRAWLSHWQHVVTINGFDVQPRDNDQSGINKKFIDPWPRVPGTDLLDMTRAPFRLEAIVYRPDLRIVPASYGGGSGGELRFVFGLLGHEDDNTNNLFRTGVIFEFGIPADDCKAIQEWAHAFHALGSLGDFDEQYKLALESLTNRVTAIGAAPGRPNGSAINSVRSNEEDFDPGEWEMREFHLADIFEGPISPLVQTTTAQTPDRQMMIDQSVRIAHYVLEFEHEILDGTYIVPLSYWDPGAVESHFRGAATFNVPTDFWSGPGICGMEARQIFSMNTCNGCHAGETHTLFQHVRTRNVGQPSGLSDFLGPTPITVDDPCGSGLKHTFFERQRRTTDFCALLNDTCEQLQQMPRFNRVH